MVTFTSGVSEPKVEVAGVAAEVEIVNSREISFEVPDIVPAGTQPVSISWRDGNDGASLEILGEDARTNSVTLLVSGGTGFDELNDLVQRANPRFELVSLNNLGGTEGPCANQLAVVDTSDTPTSEALESIEDVQEDEPTVILNVDPRTSYGSGSIDHLNAVGARASRARGALGTDSLIAILDTGVGIFELAASEMVEPSELEGRVRYDLGYDFVAEDDFPEDGYAVDSDGHGTAAAVLAAGANLGVAPAAEIMPVKVCADDGTCRSDHIIRGLCHALFEAPEQDKVVLNLSLGGATPVSTIEEILIYATDNGVPVAAAGGNKGLLPPPEQDAIHYPAAYPIDGLVAVSALDGGDNSQCIDFETLESDSEYRVGESFMSGGGSVTIEPFFFSSGEIFREGQARVSGGEGIYGQNIFMGNVNLAFGLAYQLNGLSIVYADLGGNVNLRVNDELANVADFSSLNGQTVGGAQVIVEGASNAGTIRLEGILSDVAIGGQELFIDQVCPLSDKAWEAALFSTSGDFIELAAPGVDLISQTPDGASSIFEGSSFATPLVAGAMAVWRAAEPSLSAAEIEDELRNNATSLSLPVNEVGDGLLNLSVSP